MALDGLYLAGKPLLLDIDGKVARHLADWLSHEGMTECLPRNLVDTRANPYGDSHHAFPLPVLNYPDQPPIGINQLWWPTGATRFARGYFLATENDADYFRTIAYDSNTTTPAGTVVQKHIPLTLFAQLGGKQFSSQMYLLAPRPLTSITGQRLYLLPLVDVRYWWNQTGTGSHPSRSPLLLENTDYTFRSWTNVWTVIQDEIGPITVSTFSDRFKPDPWEFTRQFESIAQMLDIAATSCGLRVVRRPNGFTFLMSPEDSAINRALNWQDPHAIIAGDAWAAFPMADRVQLLCQRLTEGAFDRRNQWWRVDMPVREYAAKADVVIIDDACHTWASYAGDPDESYGVSNINEVLHATFHASFDHTRPDCPNNDSDVIDFAREVFWNRLQYLYADGVDVTFAGIQNWRLSGFDDYMLLDFGTEIAPSTTIQSETDPQTDKDTHSLVKSHKRKLTTRVRSMPQEFGPRHILCQTDQFLRVQEHEAYFKIVEYTPPASDPVKYLPPGESAYAVAVYHDGSEWQEFSSPIDLMVKLWDPNCFACGLVGEVLHATWSDERHRWEVDRETGLIRKAMVSDTDIEEGTSGDVILWANGEETAPQIIVEAFFDWMADPGTAAPAGAECLVKWFVDEKRWDIIELACGG